MNKCKILVADDEDVIRSLLGDLLTEQGYEVFLAADGEEAVDLFFENQNIDLLLLDVMMPKLNGWTVLEEIRQLSNVPVLMLTALGEERHEVFGLNKGANDYISKPFSYEILMARIKVLLRETQTRKEQELIIGAIRMDVLNHKVFVMGEEVYVNNKEYQLLQYMMQNEGQLLTRDQMLNAIWGYEYDGSDRTVDTHIKMLRSKLNDYGRYIHTIRGTGYRFEQKEDEEVEDWQE